jgi:hypothetical protein
MVKRYKSPSPIFNDEHARVMELIKRTIPCTFCINHNHCVAVRCIAKGIQKEDHGDKEYAKTR